MYAIYLPFQIPNVTPAVRCSHFAHGDSWLTPPERKTRSQASTQAVLTSTPRAPLAGIPAVTQLRAQVDRGQIMEGAAPSRKEGRGSIRSSSFSRVVSTFPGISRTTLTGPGEDDAEEEDSDGTEAAPTPVRTFQGTRGTTLAKSNHPFSHQSGPFLLA
ncbi:hypothetical protein O181_084433 [Austropuccinia psidii MF-1]|uniref:Uncharacterized protein n=1 Tax=Austropuccinia psidii MF-1 TaxID=1389203 RepID=A0A9Q3IKM7_9BASI|nr:hypothetical protein [Austropuccinia psidii MF-1]